MGAGVNVDDKKSDASSLDSDEKAEREEKREKARKCCFANGNRNR
jgi:hypothetical protein